MNQLLRTATALGDNLVLVHYFTTGKKKKRRTSSEGFSVMLVTSECVFGTLD